uniref:Uncharacterized protein n=1 Tax=Clastoptera arizonana TaxID=38151 RepID=A0A1B6CMT2_9HEMI
MMNIENKLQTQMNDNNSKMYFDGQLVSIESEICKLQYQIDELSEQTKSIRPSIIEQSALSNKLDSVENESSISCKSLNDSVLTKNNEYRNLPINNKIRNKLVTLNQNVIVSDDESDSEVQVINITPITESGSSLCKKQSLIKHKIKSVTNLNGDCVQKPNSKMMNNDKKNSKPAKTAQKNLIDLKPLQNGIVNFQHVLGSVLNITKNNECKIKESGSFKSKTSVASKMIQKFLYDLQMCTRHIKILQNNIYKSYKNVPDVVSLENEDIITTESAGTSTKRFNNISVKGIKIKAKSQACLNDAASFHPSNEATSSVKRGPTVETNQNVKRSKLCNDIKDKNVLNVVSLENEDIITTESAGTSTKRFNNISVKGIKIKAKSQACLNDAASFHPSNEATSSVKRGPTVETNQNVKRSKLCNDIKDKNVKNLENLKTTGIVETSSPDNTSLKELSCCDYSELYEKYKIKPCSIHLQPLDNNLLKWLTDAN